MRKILFSVFIFVLAASFVQAQDAATQQQLDKLAGQIQDLTDAQRQQDKRIAALEKSVADLTDKLNQPAANNNASADDVKKLAEQVREIDKNRQADNEKTAQTLDKLAKLIGSSGGHKSAPTPPTSSDSNSSGDSKSAASDTPSKGYNYKIAQGDSLGAIAKAYRAQGVKVTTKDILNANPGLDATKLYVGKTIFIPDPNAK